MKSQPDILNIITILILLYKYTLPFNIWDIIIILNIYITVYVMMKQSLNS